MLYFFGFTTIVALSFAFSQRSKSLYHELHHVAQSEHIDECYVMIGQQSHEIDALKDSLADSKLKDIKLVNAKYSVSLN